MKPTGLGRKGTGRPENRIYTVAVNGPAGMKHPSLLSPPPPPPPPGRFRAGGKPRDRVCKQPPEQTSRAPRSELILSVSTCT